MPECKATKPGRNESESGMAAAAIVDDSRSMMDKALAELEEERAGVAHLL